MDEGYPSQRIFRQKSRTGEWVKEQQGLGQYEQTTSAEKLPSLSQEVGFEKRNEDVPKPVISTREQGSQVEKELPELLKKFVEEMVEERMRISSRNGNLRDEEKEQTGIGERVVNFPRHLPRDSPPSYTTEVRKSQESEKPRDDTYNKKKEILAKTRPEGDHQQRYVSDEGRMRGLSIPRPVNLGHLPPSMIPKEDGYGDLDRQQVFLKEKVMEYPRDVNANEGYKPLARHERKLIAKPMRATNYPAAERKEMRRGIPQEQPEYVISPEISTAEYLDALDQARIIAKRQGREDIQEILQAVLRIRAQGKREFEKASTKQTNARDSSRKETEPPRQPPDRLPSRGGAGGGGGGGGDDDPNEPDDAGDEEDDSEEEDETDSESGEGGIREQLPAELRGQRMYRLRLPLTQERQRVRNLQPNEGGGGGSSPSSSPPPSDHLQNRNPRRR